MNDAMNGWARRLLWRPAGARSRLRLVLTALLFLFSSSLLVPLSARAEYPAPLYPVIFIHGINGSPDSTWGDIRERLCTPYCTAISEWYFGGTPIFDRQTRQVHGDCTPLTKNGNFYTLKFSDNRNLSFSQQAVELYFIIQYVKQCTGEPKVILVAHSMGGLAARAYLQNMACDRRDTGDCVLQADFTTYLYSNDVAQLITVGTPHLGSVRALLMPIVPGCLTAGQICRGADELAPSSAPLSLLNDDFLIDDGHKLPTDIIYRTIIVDNVLPGTGDGVVSFQSQNLAALLAPLPSEFQPATHSTKELPIVAFDFGAKCAPGLQVHTCETSHISVQNEILGSILHRATVLSIPPVARTLPSVNTLTAGSTPTAILSGLVIPSDIGTSTAWLEYGPTPAIGSTSTVQVIAAGAGPTGVNHPLTNLTRGAITYFRTVAQSDSGTSYGKIQKFTAPTVVTNTTLLDPPGLGYPFDKEANVLLIPTFSWQEVAGASYRILIAHDPRQLPTNPSEDICEGCDVYLDVATASYTPPAGTLNPGTTYYWQVKAKTAGNHSQWSPRRAFTTAFALSTILPEPMLSAPADGSTVQTTQPTFTWSAVANATSYRVMISEDLASLPTDPASAACDECVVDKVRYTTDYTPPPDKLIPGKTYYWQVKARSPDSYGYWSERRTVTMQVSIGVQPPKVVAAGVQDTFAVKSDGTMWAWGAYGAGALGDNGVTDRQAPVLVSGLTNVIAAAANLHTVALKSDGTVWAWGYNGYGQLGDNSTVARQVPIQVSGLTGVVAIAAGASHTVALKSDGTMWAWGSNFYRQLGDNTSIDRHVPVQVSGLTGVVAVAAALSHTVALKSDGTVWAWGSNSFGQIGNDSTIDRHAPTQVSGLIGVVAIAAGAYHTVALKSDGTMWAWGLNVGGALGDNSAIERHLPVQVSGLTGVVAMAAAYSHTVALKSDGTVWAWGYNGYGELGDNSTIDRYAPVLVSGLTGVVEVAAGDSHTVARKSDGTVWAWGYNYHGQIGDNSTIERHVPVQVGTEQTGYLNLIYDVTPNSFTLGNQTGVAIGSTVVSAPVTLNGINFLTAISISGGSYSLNGGAFTSLPGTIVNGDVLRVRVTAPSTRGATATAILTIGALITGFSVTTQPVNVRQDFNGNGRSDVFWRHASGPTLVWQMNGTAIADTGSPATVPAGWTVEGIGDFDGDGKADILWRNTATGTMLVWLMDGTSIVGTGSPATVGDASGGWVVQGIGDFDGDGKADILWQNTLTGTVYVWKMNGTAISSAGSPATVPPGAWTVEGVGDFDGDGKADILWRNTTSGTMFTWLMNGTAISTTGSPATVGDASGGWVVRGVGDFDGDGKADIVWQNTGSGTVFVWKMNGAAINTTGSPATVPAGWTVEGVGDYDGDGKADLLWRHSSGNVFVWLMNGTAIAGTGSPATVTDTGWQVQNPK